MEKERSPFGDGAVKIPPDGIFPVVLLFGSALEHRLIGIDAQAFAGGKFDESILVGEDRRILDVVEQIAALIVVNAEALLLDEDVGGAAIDLHTGCECHRAEPDSGARRRRRRLRPSRRSF